MEPQKNEKLFSRNFILTSVSTFTLFTSFYFLLATLPIYLEKLGGSESEIGLIIGVFTISAVILRPFIGSLSDRQGRKKILLAGLLVFLVSMMLYNYTTDVISLLILRIFHGLGWGAVTTAATTLIADIAPPSRRGEAMGIFGMASNVAMAIGPALGFLLLSSYDFPALFMACTLIAIISMLFAAPITERIVVHTETPLFSREALSPSILMFIISLTYGSLVSFLPIFAIKQGITNPGIFFSVLAVTLIFVRAMAGRLSDTKGRKFVIIPGMFLIILSLWVLSGAIALQDFLVSAFLYGLGFGSVHPALMALLVDKVDEKERGAAMGTFTAAFDLGIGTGSILLGLLLQYSSFRIIYLAGALCVFIAMICLISGQRES